MTAKEGITYLATKVPDEEPIFILRARDITAAHAVMHWAERAERNNVPEEKVCGAIKTAYEMKKWPAQRMPD